jgi:hypothetical protein
MKGTLLIRLSKMAVDKGPIVLTGLAVIGVAATAYFTAKETPKANDALEKEEMLNGKISQVRKIRIAFKHYIRSIICAFVTILCIVFAQGLNMKHIAALGGVIAAAESRAEMFRLKTKELVGDEKFEEIEEALQEDIEPVGDDILEERVDGTGEQLFYEESSKRYFWSTIEKVLSAIYHYNRNLAIRRQALINELYDNLGLELTDEGSYLGHDLDDGEKYFGYQWADFTLKDMPADNPTGKVTIISMPYAPHNIDYHYEDFYGLWGKRQESQK